MAAVILTALLETAIDYAGMFPPASLELPEALENYRRYRTGAFAPFLGRFVVREQDLEDVPEDFDGVLAVLADHHVERATTIESKGVVETETPVYCEVPLGELPAVSHAEQFAKIRTGGTAPGTVPSSQSVADFIARCNQLQLAFKATAGLHHPLRSGETHGFINVLAASVFAYLGIERDQIAMILDESDPRAFHLDGKLRWHDLQATARDVQSARYDFIHSFGSCSFTEPFEDLQALGWL